MKASAPTLAAFCNRFLGGRTSDMETIMNTRLGTMLVASSVLVAVGTNAYALGGSNASSTTKLMVNATDSSKDIGNAFGTEGLSLSGVVLQTSAQDAPADILTDEASGTPETER